MPQHDVVTLPHVERARGIGDIVDIERLADAVAKSGMFGIKTREQALVLMSIAQAEGRHPAEAARDYHIIGGRPAKTSEAMMRDFLKAGGRVEWHSLTDDVADATFSHPAGGSVRILWDHTAVKRAGLQGREGHQKYPRAMLRARCVSEGVRTVYPAATSGAYVPEEVRDMPAMALPDASSDTTADLDQFAAVTGDAEPFPPRDILAEARDQAERGRDAFETFWKSLSRSERASIVEHMGEFRRIALRADSPFDIPPLDEPEQRQDEPPLTQPDAGPAPAPIPSDAGQPFAEGDVFSQRDHEARAATKDGLVAWRKWSKNLSRDDRDLILALFPEYEQLARDADAQRGLAL